MKVRYFCEICKNYKGVLQTYDFDELLSHVIGVHDKTNWDNYVFTYGSSMPVNPERMAEAVEKNKIRLGR